MREAREQPAWKVFAKWFHDHWGDDELPPDEPSHEWQSLEAAFASAGLAVVPVDALKKMLIAAYEQGDLDRFARHNKFKVEYTGSLDYAARMTAALPPLASGGG